MDLSFSSTTSFSSELIIHQFNCIIYFSDVIQFTPFTFKSILDKLDVSLSSNNNNSNSNYNEIYSILLCCETIINIVHSNNWEKGPIDRQVTLFKSNLYKLLIPIWLGKENLIKNTSIKYKMAISKIMCNIIYYCPFESINNDINNICNLLTNENRYLQISSFIKMKEIIKMNCLPLTNITMDDELQTTTLSPIPLPLSNILTIDNINDQPNRIKIGYLLTWLLLLDSYSNDNKIPIQLSYYFRKSHNYTNLLYLLFDIIDTNDKPNLLLTTTSFNEKEINGITSDDIDLKQLSFYIYIRMLQQLPHLVRMWYSSCDRKLAISVEKFTIKYISNYLIDVELNNLLETKFQYENFKVKVSKSNKEISATYDKDELTITSKFNLLFNY